MYLESFVGVMLETGSGWEKRLLCRQYNNNDKIDALQAAQQGKSVDDSSDCVVYSAAAGSMC